MAFCTGNGEFLCLTRDDSVIIKSAVAANNIIDKLESSHVRNMCTFLKQVV